MLTKNDALLFAAYLGNEAGMLNAVIAALIAEASWLRDRMRRRSGGGKGGVAPVCKRPANRIPAKFFRRRFPETFLKDPNMPAPRKTTALKRLLGTARADRAPRLDLLRAADRDAASARDAAS